MKFKLSVLATAVMLSLTACGGGGGGGSSVVVTPPTTGPVVPVPPEWKITENQLINFAEYNIQSATNYVGDNFIVSQVIGSGDINGDSFDDIVVGNYINFGEPIKPTVLFFNTTTFKYQVNEELQKILPTMIWPRQVAIEDFDGDGRKDLFISDHGEENQAHLGSQNKLILNTATGYVDGTNLLPQVKDFSHTISLADFDQNGKNDILVINSPFIKNLNETNTNDSYVLFNTGSVNLVKGILNLENPADINFNNKKYPSIAYHTSFTTNLNNDTVPDIILGGDDTLLIIESNAGGTYKSSLKFQVPAAFKTKFPDHYFLYSYVTAYDIDGDGQKEIIASAAHQEPVTWNWLGSYFQVLKKSSSGTWEDATEKFFPEQTQSQDSKSWCYKLYLIDVDRDGDNDLICSSAESASNIDNIFWFFDGIKFVRKEQSTYASIRLKQLFPVKLGNELYLMGQDGMSKYYGWKLGQ